MAKVGDEQAAEHGGDGLMEGRGGSPHQIRSLIAKCPECSKPGLLQSPEAPEKWGPNALRVSLVQAWGAL